MVNNYVDKFIKTSKTHKRLSEYEIFRFNLRLLRASKQLSGIELARILKMKTGKRVIDLEYGRATQPKMEEVTLLSKHFDVPIDSLLYKKAKITFE